MIVAANLSICPFPAFGYTFTAFLCRVSVDLWVYYCEQNIHWCSEVSCGKFVKWWLSGKHKKGARGSLHAACKLAGQGANMLTISWVQMGLVSSHIHPTVIMEYAVQYAGLHGALRHQPTTTYITQENRKSKSKCGKHVPQYDENSCIWLCWHEVSNWWRCFLYLLVFCLFASVLLSQSMLSNQGHHRNGFKIHKFLQKEHSSQHENLRNYKRKVRFLNKCTALRGRKLNYSLWMEWLCLLHGNFRK